MAGAEDTQIVEEFPPFFRRYKSGRVERLMGDDVVPAGTDPVTGVSSKDVDIAAGVSARLFLPQLADPQKKLPILLYFHGGVFVIESPFSPLNHPYHNSLAALAGALIVSVNYRRAPDNPIPAAFDDSWAAYQWVAGGGGGEPWLATHGDFSRIVVAGDSCGANIARWLAVRAAEEGTPKPAAAILVHPYFWGEHELAPARGDAAEWEKSEKFWRCICPGTTGADDPLINPLVGWPAAVAKTGCERLLVCVAENDYKYRAWGLAYYKALTSSGWGGAAELYDTAAEGHVFHLFRPDSDNAAAFRRKLADFINQS